jgi:hypothetical protein
MKEAEIADRLNRNHHAFADFIGRLDESQYNFLANDKWTAGQQLDHIVRSIAAVNVGLVLPKLVATILFGKSGRESVNYDRLVAQYRAKLAAGGKATGRFIPPAVRFDRRADLIGKLFAEVDTLRARLGKFTEAELDKILLPHPILGKLTVREMLYFTIYHVEHHHRAVERNLGSGAVRRSEELPKSPVS